MHALDAFLPIDRRQALLAGQPLPTQMSGALLFADLSGYTALTEAFVRLFGPKRGVDKLTQVINQLFATLIEQIHAWRGAVVGFGGDALTCWFANDDGRRAVACAFAIQQVMATFGDRQPESGEPLQLTMKTLIEIGTVHRFQVGDPRIQYLDLLAGRLLSQVAELQKYGGPGRVVVGPALLAQIGHSLALGAVYYNKIGRRQGAVVTASHAMPPLPSPWPLLMAGRATPQLDETQARLWLLPPIYERLHTGQTMFLADMRPVVILSARFEGLAYERYAAVGQ